MRALSRISEDALLELGRRHREHGRRFETNLTIPRRTDLAVTRRLHVRSVTLLALEARGLVELRLERWTTRLEYSVRLTRAGTTAAYELLTRRAGQ